MPITIHNLTRAILKDGDATPAEAELIKRLSEAGDIERTELDAIIDMIDSSDVTHDKKKDALQLLTAYKDETASGIESNLFGLDAALSSRLAREGVRTCEDLLYVASKPAGRFELAEKARVEEKPLRQLVKQADLQRADGIDDKLAKVLVDSGVDSIAELARRNPDSLHRTLKSFAGSRESWVMQFKCPSRDDVAAFIDAAKALPKLVEFGDPLNSLASMGLEQRAKLMIHEDARVDGSHVDSDNVADYLDSKGLGALKDEMRSHHIDVLDNIASNLDYHGVDVSGEGLLDGTDNYNEDDVGYYFNVQPNVNEFKGPNGDYIGSTFSWSTDDGSEGEYWTLAYDHLAGKFTALHWSESANGDSDFSMLVDESTRPLDLDALRSAGNAVHESWGDENIQDGVTTLKAEKAQYGWGRPDSMAKSVLTDYFENDSDHSWDGWVSYHNDYPLTPSAFDAAARDINKLGFQYANEGEVGRIRGQIEEAVAALGDPAQIAYATADGKARVPDVNNDEPVTTRCHLFLNRDNGAYVAVIARAGSYSDED